MSQTRVTVFDLSLGVSSLFVAAVLISGNAMDWQVPAGFGAYYHPFLEDLMLAFLLFGLGVRSTFVTRTVLFGPGQGIRYFLSRGVVTFIVGLILGLWSDLPLLAEIGILFLASVVFSQLSSTILYFLAFSMGILSISVPVLADELASAQSGMGGLNEFLLLRADALIPWSMFFLFGLIYGRYNLMDARWNRFIRVLCFILLAGAILTHFASESAFSNALMRDTSADSRLVNFGFFMYRPVFLLAAIPSCYLLFQLFAYLANRAKGGLFHSCLCRFGQFHITLLTIALIIAAIIQRFGPFEMFTSRLIGLGFILSAFVTCILLRKRLRNAPVEWLMQRFYQ